MSITNKMATWLASHLAWLMRAACIAGALLSGSAAFSAPAMISPPASQNSVPGASASNRLAWRNLSAQQQQALAPLASEWDSMENPRRQKWLQIAGRFSKMKPEEQQRTQENMREWVKLTPEQRRIVRENHARANKLNASQKSAAWKQYQQLSAEQKKKLAAAAPAKRNVANLPAHGPAKTIVPPIKATPKRVLERSVTPQIARKPSIQPSLPSSAPTGPADPH
jgi:hypothetical protein